MKISSTSFILGACILLAVACSKDLRQEPEMGVNIKKGGGKSQLFTLNNQVADNKVMVFDRAADGSISFNASYSTGGHGTGGGLGNQGALALQAGGQILLAVNAGSDEISSFSISNNGLQLRDLVSSGGVQPISITVHQNLVYVLNAGGSGNISGFKLSSKGMLTPIAGSTRALSSNAAGAAQVSFSPSGDALVVTEKATNTISSFKLNADGTPGSLQTLASAGVTPFGFSFGKQNTFVVTEASGGAAGASTVSAYQAHADGSVSLVDGPLATNSSAACWAVTVNNGKMVFITNTADNDISTIAVSPQQSLSLANGGGTTGTDAGPIDAALSRNSRYLYVLNAGGHSITSYAIGNKGNLSQIDTDSGLPPGTTGLLAK